MKRTFIMVLDSFGIGAAHDAADFGDTGADTLGHIAQACARGEADKGRKGPLHLPNLGTIAEVVNAFKKRKISFWMFPEGTRSRGRGLLPFKTGAFHAAIAAGVPIIPVCVSNTSNKIKLNRWNNGLVIVEMLPPVDTTQFGKDNVRALATHCRELMAAKIADLDNEVAEREAAGKQ